MKGITSRQIEFALQCCMQKDRPASEKGKDKCAKCPYRDGKGISFTELHKDVYYYIQRLKQDKARGGSEGTRTGGIMK